MAALKQVINPRPCLQVRHKARLIGLKKSVLFFSVTAKRSRVIFFVVYVFHRRYMKVLLYESSHFTLVIVITLY